MKTMGLLGGMSWQSTMSYYKAVNQGISDKLGGFHSAKIVMNSVDFEEIECLQRAGKWSECAEILIKAAQSLEKGGAEFMMICTNTMHKVADDIQQNISIPMIHIADATAQVLLNDGITKVGLLGTRYTMEQDFYKGRIADKFGIEVVVPKTNDQTVVHDIILQELVQGTIKDESRQDYLKVIDNLHAQGAQAVILGCTEIALLVQQEHTKVKLYDTTEIHADSAVEMALSS